LKKEYPNKKFLSPGIGIGISIGIGMNFKASIGINYTDPPSIVVIAFFESFQMLFSAFEMLLVSRDKGKPSKWCYH